MKFIDAVTHITAALIASGRMDTLRGQALAPAQTVVKEAITIAQHIEGLTDTAFGVKEE